MRVLSLFVVNWYQECFRVVVDSPRKSIVYNRYATLIFTNPVLLGFSRYPNVNFGSQRDNYKEYQKNIKTLGNPVFSRAFFMSVFWRKKIYKYRKPLIPVLAGSNGL